MATNSTSKPSFRQRLRLPLRSTSRSPSKNTSSDARLTHTPSSLPTTTNSSSGSATNPAFNAALKKHIENLTPIEREAFQAAFTNITPEELVCRTQEYDNTHFKESSVRQCTSSIEKFLNFIERLMGGVAIGIQASPDISSLVVGAVRIVIDLAVRFITFFSRLAEMMDCFSDYLKTLENYATAAQQSDLVQEALANVYGVLLSFFREARLVFVNERGFERKSPSIRQFWRAQCVPFEAVFGRLELEFQHHLRVIEHSSQAEQLNLIQKGNRDADEERQRIRQKEKAEERKSCLHWISKHDFEDQHDTTISKRHPGTGSWLIADSEFQKWLKSPTSTILWCFGKPGAGKSVLASIALEHITKHHASCKDTAIAFAYIKYDYQESQGLSHIIASFIKQLCWTKKELPKCLLELYHIHDGNAKVPSSMQYEDTFIEVAGSDIEVFLVLDALDEYAPKKREALLEFLIRLTTKLSHVKIFVTSRREQDIKQAFLSEGVPTIQIKAENVNEDIHKFVNSKVDSLIQNGKLKFRDPVLKTKIVDTLTHRCDGMFLWAALQLENLCKQRSDFDMERELSSLPNGLYETYGRMIKQISTQTTAMQKVAQKAFVWMTYPLNPIDCDAMSDAIAIDEECKSTEDLERKRYDEEAIIEACAGLLIVENGYFRFIHHSVFEYFIDPPEQMLACQYSKYFSDSESASSCLAKDSLSYMLLGGKFGPKDYDERLNTIEYWDPFFYHAAKSFDQYLQSSGEIPEDIQNHLRDILSSSDLCKYILNLRETPNPANQNENASTLVFSTSLYDLPILHTNPGVWKSRIIPSNALHLAAGYGSLAGVRWLLDLGQGVNEIDRNGFTPLTCAASQGHLEIVKYLVSMGSEVNTENALEGACRADSSRLELVKYFVEKGVDVNAQGGQYGTALQAACSTETDDLETVKYLVGKGADVNAKGGQYGSALLAASWRKNIEAMKYLIEKGADIKVQAAEDYGTVLQGSASHSNFEMMKYLIEQGADVKTQGCGTLHAAVARGNFEMVKYLIEKGADIDAQAGEDGSALSKAAAEGELEIAKYLIEKGADVNVQGGFHGNALQTAVFQGYFEIVKYLIEKGADVNVQGGFHGNALQTATSRGYFEIVKYLIEKGADVNVQRGSHGNALQTATSRGHFEIVKYLIEKGVDVNVQGGRHGNALQAAASEGNFEIVRYLIEIGADVNIQGGHYGNALQAAAFEGHFEVIKYLIENGADVNVQGDHYGNALQAAAFKGYFEIVKYLIEKGADVNVQGGYYETALQAAAFGGYFEIVKYLIEKGADVNVQEDYYGNALQAAASEGHFETVKYLIEKGADVNVQKKYYGNVLQTAAFRKHFEIVKYLIEKEIDVNVQGGHYENVLQTAAFEGYFDLVKYLIEKGADVNVQGGRHGNALQAAAFGGYFDLVKYLIEKGADVNVQGGYYGNALQAAASEGYFEMVKYLVENGADVNAQGGREVNALNAASTWGHTEIVDYLIQMGAHDDLAEL